VKKKIEESETGQETETVETTETPKSNVEEIAESLLESAPGVSQHVIEKEEQAQSEISNQGGEVFDPAIHAVDPETGEPIKTASGTYRRKPGRKAGGGGNINKPLLKSQLGSTGATTNNAGQAAPSVDSGTVAAGIATAHAIFQAGQLLGGEEWAPIKNAEYGLDETKQMETAWIEYYKAKGVTDFPPGVILLMTLGAYAAPRFALPKTKSRLQVAVSWVKNKLSRKKEEKTESK